MAQRKTADDGKTQRQKFMEAAREHGADQSQETFERTLREIAKAPQTKPKKAARKSKR